VNAPPVSPSPSLSPPDDRVLFEGFATPLAVLDRTGRFIFANQLFDDLVGVEGGLLARGLLRVLAREDHEAVKSTFALVRRTHSTAVVDARLLCLGQARWFCWTMSRPADSEVVYLSGSDVNERLEHGRLKDEFVSIVSHELRTPMTSVSGSIALLLNGVAGPMSETGQKLLGLADQNCRRLIRLINDILDISKIESGMLEFRFESFGLPGLVERVVDENATYAESAGVAVQWSCHPFAHTAYGDDDRITQVLTNLLSNAIKFSPEGGVVEVEAGLCDGGIRLSVHDRGPGIPEEMAERVFDRFQQVDGSDVRAKGGTGLGLHIVREIVHHHDGRVGFVPRDGGGTSFFVDLPLPTSDMSALISLPLSSLGEQSARSALSGRILHIESDADIATLVQAGLAPEFDVVLASSLDAAEQQLAAGIFDAVLLEPDVDIGDVRGVVARVLALIPGVPVVIFSTERYPLSGPVVTTRLLKSAATPLDVRRALERAVGSARAA
jgi:signal transduction histidine kinase